MPRTAPEMSGSATQPPSDHWLRQVITGPAVCQLRDALAGGTHRVLAEGSQGSSTTLLAGSIAAATRGLVLFVVAHLDDADDAMDDLAMFAHAGVPLTVSRFGALEVLPGESNVSLELLIERIAVVQSLESAKPQAAAAGGRIIVTPVQALMQSVPQAQAMAEMSLTLRVGGDMPMGRLFEWLSSTGYERVEAVEQPGEFAARGGIVDIYPPAGIAFGSSPDAQSQPAGAVRIDFFGDQVDSICRIDPDTMGSGERFQSVQMIGAKIDQLQSDQRTVPLWSLLPPDSIVVMHEVMELAEQARGYYERLTNPVGIHSPQSVFKALTALRHVEVNQYSSVKQDAPSVRLPVGPLASFDTGAPEAVKELAEMAVGEQGARVVVLCPKAAEGDRLRELIREHAPAAIDTIEIQTAYLHRGFVWHEQDVGGSAPQAPGPKPQALFLIPHQELFHRYDIHRRVRRIGLPTDEATTRVSDAFLDLNVGDFVVHTEHGIARFVGLRTMRSKVDKAAPPEEFLTLEFAGKTTLHVPASQIDHVQKYIGGFQGKPPLSTLGGKRWAKQKEQVTEAVKDLAAELLRVQAARSSMPGVRYPTDTVWQTEFEAEFPFDETEDQLAAIAAVKRDMSAERPMDRLVCGDVGFGKTEIAIRAAFKAAEHGKQVAVLVPTTVLADQHERTFRGRMADYPFRIETISRFRTPKQQKQTIEGLRNGSVDVVIGTHRLLSEDVKFADLGLVIIDEEQRFGVEHKNKLLQFRLTADVLTLSATPIPRTLHMSMLGLRDISSLTTPPMDRRAIVTEVMPYERNRIKMAIIRELNRDGQIFFVHNRVHNIQSVADDIKALVPEAKIIIGHGQMPGHQLEEVMLKFTRRKADILVCTTIIESGIDIPTANTIFINRADHFGLAELHQLRGRVGRYKHRAYCYLMLPEDSPITDKAARRLQAVEQYAMLGAGFKIAMRDLEIRGAGNLLGAEQSGHIAAVGYEMYCQLLEQETRRLRNDKRIDAVRTHLDLPATGQLPKTYITSDKFRMEAYRRISRASTLEQLDAVVRDMTDAYGQPPPQAQLFIDLAELRVAGSELDIEAIKLEKPDLIFRTEYPRKLEPLLADAPGRAIVIDERTVYYRPPANYLDPVATLLAVLRKLLVRPLRSRPHPAG